MVFTKKTFWGMKAVEKLHKLALDTPSPSNYKYIRFPSDSMGQT